MKLTCDFCGGEETRSAALEFGGKRPFADWIMITTAGTRETDFCSPECAVNHLKLLGYK